MVGRAPNALAAGGYIATLYWQGPTSQCSCGLWRRERWFEPRSDNCITHSSSACDWRKHACQIGTQTLTAIRIHDWPIRFIPHQMPVNQLETNPWWLLNALTPGTRHQHQAVCHTQPGVMNALILHKWSDLGPNEFNTTQTDSTGKAYISGYEYCSLMIREESQC